MQRFYLPSFVLLMLILEGVALDFLPQFLMDKDLLIVPHWMLLFLVLIAIYYDFENTYYAVLYAVIFGLMIDIVSTSVIGVYMFIYALVIYIIHGLRKVLHTNYLVAFLLAVLDVIMVDIGVYIIYFFIGINHMQWNEYMSVRLVPTLIGNMIFFILLYPIFKGKLMKWSSDRFDSKRV
ncbi:rod shape-determining protein MreD [Aquibacillus koreensis]|uniref:Rod shape-determining protein MreD n=1 Tax=Aquibacillus koreensis TaxID=279446 RepID=A0A9X4AIC2_9BACI|nr:rod shape-determining protein MreD [Aquibacillus koreensis]MCT2537956.1 rod shape-determining protein MreD [Aquibacillus koreensis]MDC3419153.1 rod shape-determining protein MreD [Aquibacillus koreensis]